MHRKFKQGTFALGLTILLYTNSGFCETLLTNSATTPNLYSAQGTGQNFKIDVPKNTAKLIVSINNGEGDADLYVRFNQPPSLRQYNCRPYLNGNNETCEIASPLEGSYYILVQGYRAFSNLNLIASYYSNNQDPGSGPQTIALMNEEVVDNLSNQAGERSDIYKIEVPEGALNLSINISGGSGDADLYVRKDKVPTDSIYSCRPYIGGNRETCSFPSPGAGTYYAQLKAYSAYSGVRLVARYSEPAEAETASGEEVDNNGDCTLSTYDQALLDAHNEARSQGRSCGGTFYPAVAPLTWQCTLATAANNHNNDMAENNFFSHTGSDGLSPFNRITNLGYTYQAAGENIAAGYSSVAAVMTGWLESPGHCANVMRSSFTEMGGDALIGVPGSQYSNYWSVTFGKPQ